MLSTNKTYLTSIVLITLNHLIYAEEINVKPVKFSNVSVSAEYGSNVEIDSYLYLPYKNHSCQITFKNYSVKNKDNHKGISIGQRPQRYSTLYQLNIGKKNATISQVSGGCQLNQASTQHYSLSFTNNNACKFTITTQDFYTPLTYSFHVSGKGKEQLIINVAHSC